LLAVGVLFSVALGAMWNSMPEAARAEEAAMWMPTPDQAREQLGHLLGSYPHVVAHRARFVFMTQTMYFLVFFFWRVGGMMLLGMSLYKFGFLDGRRSTRGYALVAATCIPLGLALAWNGVVELERVRFTMPGRATADLWNYVGSVLASVGYAAALILLVKRGALGLLRRALAAVGQMAFTNYLFQSVVTSILFLGWGLGLAGRVDYAQQLIIVAAIWIFQLVISPIWLERFRFGPAEWLWRSLTYGRRQPMRRQAKYAA